MRGLIITLLICSTSVNAQVLNEREAPKIGKNEINFEGKLNWEQILKKAKEEHKLIFVDCIASWCAPCKRMDNETYKDENVCRVVNENFISVKIQLDTSSKDNLQTREWYADAHKVKEKYNVDVFPTYLFLSPEGSIVHKGMGYMKGPDFISLLTDAQNPSKQYYHLLDKYEKGEKDISSMAYLITVAQSLRDSKTIAKVGADYTMNYLVNLSDDKIFTKENLLLLSNFTKSTQEKGFKIFFDNTTRIDSILGNKGFSSEFITGVILNEVMIPKIKQTSDGKIDWNSVEKEITDKYSQHYAKKVVARGKIFWYYSRKDYANYSKTLVEYIDLVIPENDMINYWYYMNGNAWNVFLYSNSKPHLKIAASWVKKIMDDNTNPDNRNPNLIDTYANLMYKLGKKKIALEYEKKAVEIAPTDEGIKKNYDKMKSNTPTW